MIDNFDFRNFDFRMASIKESLDELRRERIRRNLDALERGVNDLAGQVRFWRLMAFFTLGGWSASILLGWLA